MPRPKNTSGFCKNKHPMTPDNVYVVECCRACTIARALKSQANRKVEKKPAATL